MVGTGAGGLAAGAQCWTAGIDKYIQVNSWASLARNAHDDATNRSRSLCGPARSPVSTARQSPRRHLEEQHLPPLGRRLLRPPITALPRSAARRVVPRTAVISPSLSSQVFVRRSSSLIAHGGPCLATQILPAHKYDLCSFSTHARLSFAQSPATHRHRIPFRLVTQERRQANADSNDNLIELDTPPDIKVSRCAKATLQEQSRSDSSRMPRSSPPPGPYAPLLDNITDGNITTTVKMAQTSTSASTHAEVLLARLTHALVRINQTAPRTIASPPTQPRRASVAILIRVRPHEEDDEWLSEQYDADGQPLPGSEAERLMNAPIDASAFSSISAPNRSPGTSSSSGHSAHQRSHVPPHASITSASSIDASLLGASGMSSSGVDVAPGSGAESAVDVGGLSTALSGSSSRGGDVGGPDVDPVPRSAASVHSSSASSSRSSSGDGTHETLQRFFSLPWVQRGQPEVLYIKRASRETDKWSAHVAFPGGRKEEGDENGLYTAMRETWEEIGLDLAEKEFVNVGKLDDREITTSLGKRLLMVLSPYIFVQTSPFSPIPDLQPSEVASAHWIPLRLLYTPTPKWGVTSVDIASRLAPKSPVVRWSLRALVGKMDFRCILLPNKPIAVADDDEDNMTDALKGTGQGDVATDAPERPELKLWGLTLGMTLDLLSQMSAVPHTQAPAKISPSDSNSFANLVKEPKPKTHNLMTRLRNELHLSPPPAATSAAPSMTSVFPRFSYPDVNFWIWVFGWRYRNIVRTWERSVGTGMAQTVNWSGMALGAFYSAVRRALVVAIVLRALGFLSTASAAVWLTGRRIQRMRRGQTGFGLDELLSR